MQPRTTVTHVLTEPEAAAHIGISLSGLRKWRNGGRGPRYFQIGRLIRYKTADLEAWLTKHAISPESPDDEDRVLPLPERKS